MAHKVERPSGSGLPFAERSGAVLGRLGFSSLDYLDHMFDPLRGFREWASVDSRYLEGFVANLQHHVVILVNFLSDLAHVLSSRAGHKVGMAGASGRPGNSQLTYTLDVVPVRQR